MICICEKNTTFLASLKCKSHLLPPGSQSGEGSKSEYLNSAFHGENNQDYVKDTG